MFVSMRGLSTETPTVQNSLTIPWKPKERERQTILFPSKNEFSQVEIQE